MYQVFDGDRKWKGESPTLAEAEAFAEGLLRWDGEDGAHIQAEDGTWLESAGLDEHGALVWKNSDLIRRHDGRA